MHSVSKLQFWIKLQQIALGTKFIKLLNIKIKLNVTSLLPRASSLSAPN